MDLGVKLSKLQHQVYVGEVPPWGRFGFRWFSLSSTQLPGLAQEYRKLASHCTVTFLMKVRAEAESGVYKRKSRDYRFAGMPVTSVKRRCPERPVTDPLGIQDPVSVCRPNTEKQEERDNVGSRTLHSRAETTPSPTNNTGNGHPEYIAYALVPVFFIMGLFGVLICHLLKKKGYRCTTEAEQDIEEEKVEKIELNESINENSDTVGQIVHYIMKNEANADVLKAMVADNSLCDPESPVSPSTPGSPPVSPGPLSPGATPGKHVCGHHLHTVGGAVERDVCQRCRHKRWHFTKPTNKSKESRPRRQGEVTVLSVGRFRVTKVEHKSNQKERRSLMSVSGAEGVNGEVPATPVKRERSDTE